MGRFSYTNYVMLAALCQYGEKGVCFYRHDWSTELLGGGSKPCQRDGYFAAEKWFITVARGSTLQTHNISLLGARV